MDPTQIDYPGFLPVRRRKRKLFQHEKNIQLGGVSLSNFELEDLWLHKPAKEATN
jgi:hypothetical protein